MNFNFVSSSRGIIENADKAFLLILMIIDVFVLMKYFKTKKMFRVFQSQDIDDNKSIDLDSSRSESKRNNIAKTYGIENKTMVDNYFINFIVEIKLIELLVIIRMMFIISFYCRNICNAIDKNGPQTGNIYNFILALISAIFVIIFCTFSIQYINILKCKLLGLVIQRKMLLSREQGGAH